MWNEGELMGNNDIVQAFLKNPIPFLGGFAAGALRLNLSEDPLKGWLESQGIDVSDDDSDDSNPPSSNGPQTISID